MKGAALQNMYEGSPIERRWVGGSQIIQLKGLFRR